MTDDNPFGRIMETARQLEESPERQELFRAAAGVRRIIRGLVSNQAPLDELRRLAGVLETLASDLEAHSSARAYEDFAESANAGSPYSFFDHSPLIGRANPLAPPAEMHIEGDRVVGTVRFGAAYEGPPGHVHGGYIAAVFDELLGMAQSLSGQSGMTGTLEVRYRQPTPLEADLDLQAQVVRVEGRKVYVSGRCFHQGRLTAEADGIFISIDFGRFRRLLGGRETPRSPAPGEEAQAG